MSTADAQPRLRLVGAYGPARPGRTETPRERRAVVRENRLAARNGTLDPADARWVLAVRAQSQLAGSTLTPERRQRVLRTARRLGIRPFDANLIIAVVQDRARRGEGLAEAAPTLALITPPARARPGPTWARWAAALGTAVVANLLLIRWLLS